MASDSLLPGRLCRLIDFEGPVSLQATNGWNTVWWKDERENNMFIDSQDLVMFMGFSERAPKESVWHNEDYVQARILTAAGHAVQIPVHWLELV